MRIKLTTVTASKSYTVNHPNLNNLKFKVRDTEKFEIETFSLPSHQPLPTKHYEVKTFAVVGPIGSGKTTLTKEYYGNRVKQLWRDDVDMFLARDLWATIEAVKNSDKFCHFLIIDDSVPMFDSRRSMSNQNVDVTQMFFEIRHELQKYAKKDNKAGLVIISILTQDHKAIDKRIRKGLAFTVFKAYDEVCDDLIDDPTVIQVLKKIKDKTVRVGDYFYRQLAVAVDWEGRYTLFYADRSVLPKLEFEYVTGDDIFIKQRDYLVQFLIDNFNLQEASKDDLKAELHYETDRMKRKSNHCRIYKSDFSEIIIRAKRKQKLQMEQERRESLELIHKMQEKQRKLEEKMHYNQYHHLINILVRDYDLDDLNRDYLRAVLLYETEKIDKASRCLIGKKEFREIIIKAKFIRKNILKRLKKSKKKQQTSDDKMKNKVVGGWDKYKIVFLHDTLGLSFDDIEVQHGIPHSTAHRQYKKAKKMIKNCFTAERSGELQMAAT